MLRLARRWRGFRGEARDAERRGFFALGFLGTALASMLGMRVLLRVPYSDDDPRFIAASLQSDRLGDVFGFALFIVFVAIAVWLFGRRAQRFWSALLKGLGAVCSSYLVLFVLALVFGWLTSAMTDSRPIVMR